MSVLRILGRALVAWWNDNALRLGASVAYYTLFAIAPILLVAIAIAGTLFGAEAVRGQLAGQIDALVGPDGGMAVQALLQGASRREENIIAAIIGGVTLGTRGVWCLPRTAGSPEHDLACRTSAWPPPGRFPSGSCSFLRSGCRCRFSLAGVPRGQHRAGGFRGLG